MRLWQKKSLYWTTSARGARGMVLTGIDPGGLPSGDDGNKGTQNKSVFGLVWVEWGP